MTSVLQHGVETGHIGVKLRQILAEQRISIRKFRLIGHIGRVVVVPNGVRHDEIDAFGILIQDVYKRQSFESTCVGSANIG